jgi:hypothetical protein
MHDLSSPQREVSLTCAHTPAADPYFAPQRELLAATIVTGGVAEATQP